MFGLFKSKSVNFGALIKERDKVVVLLQADLASSLDTLSFLGSWQKEFKRVIVKTDEYRVRFWQSLLKEDNLEVKSQLNPEDKEKAIVLDFDGNKADVQKFKESLILSSNQQLCNFSFSSWEPVLASFSKLFSLKLQSKQVVDTPKDFGNSQGLILVDLAFDKKIKRLQEQQTSWQPRATRDCKRKISWRFTTWL